MRKVSVKDITAKVKELCIAAACHLEPDAAAAIRVASEKEASPLGREVLAQIIKNFEIADAENVPMCQDTGISVFFVEAGRGVELDGSLEDAINEGVRQGYKDGYLRKSVCDPLKRTNTGDNTPAIIHTRMVEGDKVKIKFAPKGAGSENMSRLKMLKPSEGVPGIKGFVVEAVREAGGNPCPPIIVGVGIGGDFEQSAILAKKALLRPVGGKNLDGDVAGLEEELLKTINGLGIGPMGFGGTVTALAVHIETYPCHIASLPVAVNIQCHADRHKEAVI
ncbi:MAG: fumarate hydratase [Deltaproteobacteria bacterium]|nr:fumarate hydratase [Deltaproteobacteria bacterium]